MAVSAWDAATQDHQMIAWLGWEESGLARKRRLYLAALCRHFWKYLPSATGRQAIEAAEAFVDGRVSADDLRAAHVANRDAYLAEITARGKQSVHTRGVQVAHCAYEASRPEACRMVPAWSRTVTPITTGLLRDLFVDPFRPVAFDPRWRTADVVGMARGIYEERAFDRLPILADALMDAGCEDAAILGHCRSTGPHVRGCWVVDLVLGKE
jgi:hypothetical protein